MPLFQSGQSVKLSQYTGDDQIDFYYGQTLTIDEYTPITTQRSGYHHTIENYNVRASDGVIISCNEYELRPVVRRRNRRTV